MKQLINRLSTEFEDQEYAHAYMEDNLVTRLAAQIYALRKERGWTQKDLARKSGVAQERISKIESADFDSLTMGTLHKFSRAFDVNLIIKFNEFSKGLLDIANVNQESLKVTSRADDLKKFKGLQVKVDNKGIWRSVRPGNLVEITTFPTPPTTQKATPFDKWISLTQSAPVAVNTLKSTLKLTETH